MRYHSMQHHASHESSYWLEISMAEREEVGLLIATVSWLYLCLMAAQQASAVSALECPDMAFRYPGPAASGSGSPKLLDLSNLNVTVGPQETFGLEGLQLVSGGQAIPTFVSLPSNVTHLPIQLSLGLQGGGGGGGGGGGELYFVMALHSGDESVAPPNCPSPGGGQINSGAEAINVSVGLSCQAKGEAVQLLCLTFGTKDFDDLTGAYHTIGVELRRECAGTNGVEMDCDFPSPGSFAPADFCLTAQQTSELASYGAGSWDLVFSAFENNTSPTRGFCLVDTVGLIGLVADPDLNKNFPIPWVFPTLNMFVRISNRATSPVLFSFAISSRNTTVVPEVSINIPYGVTNNITTLVLNLTCASNVAGFTEIDMEFNTSVLVGTVLYREDYMFSFYRDCYPVEENETVATRPPSKPGRSSGLIVGLSVSFPLLSVLIFLVVVLVVFLLTQRHKKKVFKLEEMRELQMLASNNLYMQMAWQEQAFSFLEGKDLEYNFASIQIEEELGQGCFGKVYKARAPGLSRGKFSPPGGIVAVKTLKEDGEDQMKLLEEFSKEVKVCVEFEHENIVQLLGVCTKSLQKCIIFEFMSLGGLDGLLHRSDPSSPEYQDKEGGGGRGGGGESTTGPVFTPDMFLNCVVQVARGLAYLAELQYVHRDIATRNCLVGKGFVTKIGDFGLSRSIGNEEYYRIGSSAILPIRWMPPESLLYGKFTLKSDVWSFGVLMWEVYTYGCQPYTGASNTEVIDYIKQGGVELECPALCPNAMYEVMRSCWVRQSAKRPPINAILNGLIQIDT